MNHRPYQERFKQVRGEGKELAGGRDQSQLRGEGRYPRRFGDWKRERPSKMNKGKKKKFKKSRA